MQKEIFNKNGLSVLFCDHNGYTPLCVDVAKVTFISYKHNSLFTRTIAEALEIAQEGYEYASEFISERLEDIKDLEEEISKKPNDYDIRHKLCLLKENFLKDAETLSEMYPLIIEDNTVTAGFFNEITGTVDSYSNYNQYEVDLWKEYLILNPDIKDVLLKYDVLANREDKQINRHGNVFILNSIKKEYYENRGINMYEMLQEKVEQNMTKNKNLKLPEYRISKSADPNDKTPLLWQIGGIKTETGYCNYGPEFAFVKIVENDIKDLDSAVKTAASINNSTSLGYQLYTKDTDGKYITLTSKDIIPFIDMYINRSDKDSNGTVTNNIFQKNGFVLLEPILDKEGEINYSAMVSNMINIKEATTITTNYHPRRHTFIDGEKELVYYSERYDDTFRSAGVVEIKDMGIKSAVLPVTCCPINFLVTDHRLLEAQEYKGEFYDCLYKQFKEFRFVYVDIANMQEGIDQNGNFIYDKAIRAYQNGKRVNLDTNNKYMDVSSITAIDSKSGKVKELFTVTDVKYIENLSKCARQKLLVTRKERYTPVLYDLDKQIYTIKDEDKVYSAPTKIMAKLFNIDVDLLDTEYINWNIYYSNKANEDAKKDMLFVINHAKSFLDVCNNSVESLIMAETSKDLKQIIIKTVKYLLNKGKVGLDTESENFDLVISILGLTPKQVIKYTGFEVYRHDDNTNYGYDSMSYEYDDSELSNEIIRNTEDTDKADTEDYEYNNEDAEE